MLGFPWGSLHDARGSLEALSGIELSLPSRVQGKLKIPIGHKTTMEVGCAHGDTEFLGEQKGERGTNKYYRCLKCGNVLVLSEEGILYEIPGKKAPKGFEGASSSPK